MINKYELLQHGLCLKLRNVLSYMCVSDLVRR